MASQPRLMGVERSKREAVETVGPFETAVSEVNGTAVPVFLCFFCKYDYNSKIVIDFIVGST